MNFNPNTIMKQKIQQMISQRFGSVDNMMNDMSKIMIPKTRNPKEKWMIP